MQFGEKTIYIHIIPSILLSAVGLFLLIMANIKYQIRTKSIIILTIPQYSKEEKKLIKLGVSFMILGFLCLIISDKLFG